MFHPSSAFPFLATLERGWQIVRDECDALLPGEFDAWPERELYNRGWDVYGLYLAGRPLLENCVFCPSTARLLETVPGLQHAGFSRLAPGTEIAPHVGYSGAVLRLHLALRAQGDCALRVGGETRRWMPGEGFVFDDTAEHAAWNRSDAPRIVLLADFLKSAASDADACR
ncbi:aspartyl/asparaginyl beta-hydroxylase domain-containing protein [Burkholderia gladioli]|uniref:aspartyl/asparaginyl beta-hydroxylase domain-containing protein n=1 Tax=Burkholderia gladioli TaxID=28095 RepID=UPI00202ED80D|nr:aspartyl/asparaginyl beta-hydroxylase domain-containing protein [Burkholderia gladioli]URV27512.1 aspartyl/asparaginyl beta-hydroxylase domain-containing protein [Burkholderia gladioli]